MKRPSKCKHRRSNTVIECGLCILAPTTTIAMIISTVQLNGVTPGFVFMASAAIIGSGAIIWTQLHTPKHQVANK